MRASLRMLRDAVHGQQGREVPFSLDGWPLIITVSDGEGTGSVAVAVWKPREKDFIPRITRVDVPVGAMQSWTRGGARGTAIMEIEAVGPLLAMSTWSDLFRDSLWLHFIDNEASKYSLIKGSARASESNAIMHATWNECRLRRLYPWWDRVATKDNPVDQASRGDLSDLYGQHWVVDEPVLPEILRNLQSY